MTPTEREFGRLEQEVATLVHRARGDRLLIKGLMERQEQLELELSKLTTRIYATIASFMLVAGFLGWGIKLIVSVS